MGLLMFAAWISKDAQRAVPKSTKLIRLEISAKKGWQLLPSSASREREGGRDNCSSLKYRITLQIAIFNPCILGILAATAACPAP